MVGSTADDRVPESRRWLTVNMHAGAYLRRRIEDDRLRQDYRGICQRRCDSQYEILGCGASIKQSITLQPDSTRSNYEGRPNNGGVRW